MTLAATGEKSQREEGVISIAPKETQEFASEELIEQLISYIANTEISHTKVARAIGISAPTLSQILKGTYPLKDDGKVIEAIKAFLRVRESGWEIEETSTRNQIIEVCRRARDDQGFYVIIGKSGLGKTEGLLAYIKMHGGFFVDVKASFTPKAFLWEILRAIGEGWTPYRGLYDRYKVITRKLAGYKRPLLIIDQANRLSIKALEILRDIHDDVRCGLILTGVRRLEELLMKGNGWGDDLEQLFGRIHGIVHPDKITYSECERIVAKYNVRAKKAQEYCYSIMKTGGMRALSLLVLQAQRLTAQKNGHRNISLEMLEQARKYLALKEG
jgi:DNA transposition AAA+ family ATPase